MQVLSLLAVLTGGLAAVQANPWSEGQWSQSACTTTTYSTATCPTPPTYTQYAALSTHTSTLSCGSCSLDIQTYYPDCGCPCSPYVKTVTGFLTVTTTYVCAESTFVWHRPHHTYNSGSRYPALTTDWKEGSKDGMRLRARQDYGAWLTGQFNTPVRTSSDQPVVAYTAPSWSDGQATTVPAIPSNSVYHRSHNTYQSELLSLPEYTSLGDMSSTGMRLRARQDYGAWLLNQFNTPASSSDSVPQTMMPSDTLSQSMYIMPQPLSVTTTPLDTTYTRLHHTYRSGPVLPSPLQTLTAVDSLETGKGLRARQDYGAWLLSQFNTPATSSDLYAHTLPSSPTDSSQSTDATDEPKSSILGATSISIYHRTHQTYGSGFPAPTNITN